MKKFITTTILVVITVFLFYQITIPMIASMTYNNALRIEIIGLQYDKMLLTTEVTDAEWLEKVKKDRDGCYHDSDMLYRRYEWMKKSSLIFEIE